ncbi:4-hydroxyphenylpyruvate dioxygenase [Micromonospora sp. CA-240977]|uniref:4-hydroxyphenylpyruvate dioxygenase n=1 Tax=Micromonospora sp. CA-240977 TaxID=3239957 RepID=UPI003D8C0E9D
MSPQAIAYAELFVADQAEAVDYLSSCFGLVPVAVAGPETGTPDRRSTMLRNGAVTMLVTVGLDPEGPVAAYVERHGDSIADLALTTDDVQSDFERATRAGAAALVPPRPSHNTDNPTSYAVVSGFGELRHTLVTATDPAGVMPPDRRWSPLPDAEPVPRDLLALDHVAVCLPAGSLRQTVAFYDAAFGTPYYSSEFIQVGDQAMDSIVVRNETGGITLTLIEPDPTRRPGQIDQFLTAHGGAGVQHLAFLVDDIVTKVGELRSRGVDFLSTPETYYDMLEQRVGAMGDRINDLRRTNVLVDRDSWGYLLQLFTRAPHGGRTLFYELIQRDGARGFGSANIKALYEAVERSQQAAAR